MNTNTGHGHVWKRPDGRMAKCGGPSICEECMRDQAALNEPERASTASAITDEIDLIRAVLRGYPSSIASRDALRGLEVVRRSLTDAAPTTQPTGQVNGETPDRRGVYAWVTPDGHASLTLVSTRPTDHCPPGKLNAVVIDSSKFYDGCAVDSWGKDGRWVLLHDFSSAASRAAVEPSQPAPAAPSAWQPIESVVGSPDDILLLKTTRKQAIETGWYARNLLDDAIREGDTCVYAAWMHLPAAIAASTQAEQGKEATP